MLLRNNLSLSLDASEVSLQKLLSLVAERLIDSNSNVQVSLRLLGYFGIVLSVKIGSFVTRNDVWWLVFRTRMRSM